MRGNYELVTAPNGYPVTTAECKTWLRESGTTYDDQIDLLIAAATDEAEKVMYRQILSATYKTYFDEFERVMQIWKTPVTSITHIKYQDVDNVQQTLATADYSTDLVSAPARIHIINAPALYQYGFNKVEVQFVTGWANAAAVPSIIKAAIMTRVATYYETPQSVVIGSQVNEIPLWFERMLSSYKADYV